MRYRGGGVGHSFVPIPNHDPATPEDELAMDPPDDSGSELGSHDPLPNHRISSESEEGQSHSEDDGDIGERSLEGGNESDEDHLGPEDGEGDLVELEDEAGYGQM